MLKLSAGSLQTRNEHTCLTQQPGPRLVARHCLLQQQYPIRSRRAANEPNTTDPPVPTRRSLPGGSKQVQASGRGGGPAATSNWPCTSAKGPYDCSLFRHSQLAGRAGVDQLAAASANLESRLGCFTTCAACMPYDNNAVLLADTMPCDKRAGPPHVPQRQEAATAGDPFAFAVNVGQAHARSWQLEAGLLPWNA